MLVLLDTHVWIWLVGGDARRIGRRTRQLVAQRLARDAIRVSPASVFEVAALYTSRRLRLALPLEQWIREALDGVGVRVAPLSSSIAVDAGQIGREALEDPLDRLLAVTARQIRSTPRSSRATRGSSITPPGSGRCARTTAPREPGAPGHSRFRNQPRGSAP